MFPPARAVPRPGRREGGNRAIGAIAIPTGPQAAAGRADRRRTWGGLPVGSGRLRLRPRMSRPEGRRKMPGAEGSHGSATVGMVLGGPVMTVPVIAIWGFRAAPRYRFSMTAVPPKGSCFAALPANLTASEVTVATSFLLAGSRAGAAGICAVDPGLAVGRVHGDPCTLPRSF